MCGLITINQLHIWAVPLLFNKMKTLVITLGIIIVVLLGVLVFVPSSNDAELSSMNMEENSEMMDKRDTMVEDGMAVDETDRMMEKSGEEHTVNYSSAGYTPREITIKVGDTVNFVNTDGSAVWTATDVHPTHTLYPGSDIKKCFDKSGEVPFDQCKRETSGTYSYTFMEVGSWSYHNHVMAGHGGKIIVSN